MYREYNECQDYLEMHQVYARKIQRVSQSKPEEAERYVKLRGKLTEWLSHSIQMSKVMEKKKI